MKPVGVNHWDSKPFETIANHEIIHTLIVGIVIFTPEKDRLKIFPVEIIFELVLGFKMLLNYQFENNVELCHDLFCYTFSTLQQRLAHSNNF